MNIVSTNLFTTGTVGDYDSAMLSLKEGEKYLIRVAASEEAFAKQDKDLKGLIALHAGIRSRLPFSIPKAVGHVDVDGTEGYIYKYIPGERMPLSSVQPDSLAGETIGKALAAVHNLPSAFIDDYALQHLTSGDLRQSVEQSLDAALKSGKLPRAVAERWEEAVSFSPLWRFETTVCNGNITEQSFLYQDGMVSGILGWGDLRISDPAIDLSWCAYPSTADTADTIFASYDADRESVTDPQLRRRAMLYAEVAMAKWLLFGYEQDDAQVIADGTAMLARLAEDIYADLMPSLVPEDETAAVAAEDSSSDEPHQTFDVAEALDDLRRTPEHDRDAEAQEPTDQEFFTQDSAEHDDDGADAAFDDTGIDAPEPSWFSPGGDANDEFRTEELSTEELQFDLEDQDASETEPAGETRARPSSE